MLLPWQPVALTNTFSRTGARREESHRKEESDKTAGGGVDDEVNE